MENFGGGCESRQLNEYWLLVLAYFHLLFLSSWEVSFIEKKSKRV